MKSLLALYLLIGLLLSPFVYSNNGQKYRSGSTAYKVGQSVGASAVFWPSYIFAWEPEINGDSETEFVESITTMSRWRDEKYFSGGTAADHLYLLMSSIGLCLIDEGYEGTRSNAFSDLFNQEASNFATTAKHNLLQKKVMKRFDGMDFKDVLDEGYECSQKLGFVK